MLQVDDGAVCRVIPFIYCTGACVGGGGGRLHALAVTALQLYLSMLKARVWHAGRDTHRTLTVLVQVQYLQRYAQNDKGTHSMQIRHPELQGSLNICVRNFRGVVPTARLAQLMVRAR